MNSLPLPFQEIQVQNKLEQICNDPENNTRTVQFYHETQLTVIRAKLLVPDNVMSKHYSVFASQRVTPIKR